MPTYRIYYAERTSDPTEISFEFSLGPAGRGGRLGSRLDSADSRLRGRELEQEIEAPSIDSALDEFFKNHVKDDTQLRSVDETGRIHPLEGFEYDPEKTYVWEENGKRMEYQGISEVSPGFVTCPVCNGWGEVEKAIADWYGAKQRDQIVEDDQEEERPTWG